MAVDEDSVNIQRREDVSLGLPLRIVTQQHALHRIQRLEKSPQSRSGSDPSTKAAVLLSTFVADLRSFRYALIMTWKSLPGRDSAVVVAKCDGMRRRGAAALRGPTRQPITPCSALPCGCTRNTTQDSDTGLPPTLSFRGSSCQSG